MFALIVPTVDLHAQWLEAHHEWGPGLPEDGFGVQALDDVDSPSGFASWVEQLHQQSDPSRDRRANCRWMVEEDRVLGGIALRHGMNDVTSKLGHIGYGVRPSARRRGVATWALGEMLLEARNLGMDRVLVVCEADNVASMKTVGYHGGVLEPLQDLEHSRVCRYWIDVARING